jgi:hypothetical protein
MIKKMYRVFNELHTNKKDAQNVLSGWEHKEKITEVYAIATDLPNFINLELDKSIFLAPTMERALEIKEEEEL